MRVLSFKQCILMICLAVLMGTTHFSQNSAAGVLSVYFYEGRGNDGYDAVLIQTPDGTNVVIDSGTELSGSGFSRFLIDHGVGQIDYLFATNAGPGYVGLHDDLIWQYGRNIDKIVEVGQPSAGSQYIEYIQTACANGIEMMVPRDGDTLRWGSVKVTFFGPTSAQLPWVTQEQICSNNYGNEAESGSTYSLVFMLEYENISYLFAGDLGDEELEALLERHAADLQSSVLKLPRNGGNLGVAEGAFFTAVSPSVAVASASPLDSRGRPCDSLLQRLAQIDVATYITGIHGSISIHSDGQSSFIETAHEVTSDPIELQSRNSSAGNC